MRPPRAIEGIVTLSLKTVAPSGGPPLRRIEGIDPRACAQRLRQLTASGTAGGKLELADRTRLLEAQAGEIKLRFAEARERALTNGLPKVDYPEDLDRNDRAARLVWYHLQPFRPHFNLGNLTLPHLAIVMGQSPLTFIRRLQGAMRMPPELFFDTINLLGIADPSWLFYLTYKRELNRYFDPRTVDGKVVLVTKGERPIDLADLKKRGFGGLVYDARVAGGLTLEQVDRRLSRKSGGRRGIVDSKVVADVERNRTRLHGKNAYLFDLFIEALGLDPSASYLAHGRTWIPGLIEVYNRADWEADRKSAKPIAPRLASPYELETVTPDPARGAKVTVVQAGEGSGAFLRAARRASGLHREEMEERLHLAYRALEQYEIRDIPAPLWVLRGLVPLYAAAIGRQSRYSQDPLSELVFRQNLHFYRLRPNECRTADGKAVFIGSERDARVARELLPLSDHDYRKRFFLLRASRGMTGEEAAEELGATNIVVFRLEEVRENQFPSLDLITRIARFEKRSGETLPAWLESVQQTLFPQIPWRFLQDQKIFPMHPSDVGLLTDYLQSGGFRDDSLPWVLLRWRLRLDHQYSRQEAARRMDLVSHTLLALEHAEQGLRGPTRRKVAAALGISRRELNRILKGTYGERPVETPPINYPPTFSAWRVTIPEESDRLGLLPGRSYKVFENTFGNAGDREQVDGAIERLAADHLPSDPYLLLRIPIRNNGSLEAVAQRVLNAVRASKVPKAHVVLFSGNDQFEVRKSGRTVKRMLIGENTVVESLLFQAEARANFIESLPRGAERVDPYPTASETSNDRLRFLHRYPQFTHWFPQALTNGLLMVHGDQLREVLGADLSPYKIARRDDALASTALFLGWPEPLVFLRMHPEALYLFDLLDRESGEPLVFRSDHVTAMARRSSEAAFGKGFNPFLSYEESLGSDTADD